MSLARPTFCGLAALAIGFSTVLVPVNAGDLGLGTVLPTPAFQTPMADLIPTSDGNSRKACSEDSDDSGVCARETTGWSLPLEGLLGTAGSGIINSDPKRPKRFDASINVCDDHDRMTGRIDELMDAALARDSQTSKLDKAVQHYRTKRAAAVAESKDTMDYLIPYRGFGPSSEAGDIILGEQIKLKSRAAAEYAKQKHIDELHYKIVSTVMQVAMGVGMEDSVKGKAAAASGLAALKELVGEDQAQQTHEMLRSWAAEVHVPDSVYQQGAWEVSIKEAKMQTLLAGAVESDPVVKEVTNRLHKYNHRSKFARASGHIIQTTLGAASLTPDFVGPAAKTALVAFVMSTGGPEQCKLLKELYLDKRFESRVKALSEQAHLALDNYQVAILTHNPVLLASAESLVDEIAGENTVSSVFGRSVLPESQIAAGPIRQQ